MKRIRSIFILCFLLTLFGCGPQFSAVNNPGYSAQNLDFLDKQKLQRVINSDTVSLHFVEIKNVEANPVVMIHGTPGSWDAFRYVLGNNKLSGSYHLISVDRLGWGESKNTEMDLSLIHI